jgi:hypothetical protein
VVRYHLPDDSFGKTRFGRCMCSQAALSYEHDMQHL